MHSVNSRIRHIPAALLPKVRDMNGTERTANDAELLNMGIARIDGDYYSCREQSNDVESPGTMKPLVPINGTVITEGPVRQRHDNLPQNVKVDLWRARVKRTTGTGKNKKTVAMEVGSGEILQSDAVESAGVKKHRWSGEAEQ